MNYARNHDAIVSKDMQVFLMHNILYWLSFLFYDILFLLKFED